MSALALASHALAAAIWVGGMFLAYVVLRPSVAALPAGDRLALWQRVFSGFFPWVIAAIVVLLVSGYWLLFVTYGGFASVGVHVHIMHLTGLVMFLLFFHLYFVPWKRFRRAMAAGDRRAGHAMARPDQNHHRRQSRPRPPDRRHRCQRPLLALIIWHRSWRSDDAIAYSCVTTGTWIGQRILQSAWMIDARRLDRYSALTRMIVSVVHPRVAPGPGGTSMIAAGACLAGRSIPSSARECRCPGALARRAGFGR